MCAHTSDLRCGQGKVHSFLLGIRNQPKGPSLRSLRGTGGYQHLAGDCNSMDSGVPTLWSHQLLGY